MPKDKQTRLGRPPTIFAKAIAGARLPQDLDDKLDAWAKARGISRSQAVRQLLEIALAKGARTPRKP